jgi:DNA-binding NarL/FixJ family response regulator
MTTVLIVDDQALQRMGFSVLLEAQPDMNVVGEATNGTEATRRIVQSGGRAVAADDAAISPAHYP